MTEYVKFTEHNEWEGETWHFWIPVEGNEDAIGQLVNVVSDMDTYETSLRRRTEQEVDLLVEEATGTTYMAAHNKLSGKLVLPPREDLLDEDEDEDPLYKGGIRDFMC